MRSCADRPDGLMAHLAIIEPVVGASSSSTAGSAVDRLEIAGDVAFPSWHADTASHPSLWGPTPWSSEGTRSPYRRSPHT